MAATRVLTSATQLMGHLKVAGGATVLDAALVLATQHLEVAAITPGGRPGVLDQPVRRAVLRAVADDLDGVAAERLARLVLVDARLVGGEVSVDGEADLERAVLHQLLLVVGAVDGVGVGQVVLALAPGAAVVAGLVAGRRVDEVEAGLLGGRAGGDGAALADEVRVARLRHQAALLRVTPGSAGLAALAAAVEEAVVAGDKVQRSQLQELGVVLLDAEAVADALGSSERPAGAALGLVQDGADALAPLRARVEGSGRRLAGGELLLRQLGQDVLLRGAHAAHEVARLPAVEVAVGAGGPRAAGHVDDAHDLSHLVGAGDVLLLADVQRQLSAEQLVAGAVDGGQLDGEAAAGRVAGEGQVAVVAERALGDRAVEVEGGVRAQVAALVEHLDALVRRRQLERAGGDLLRRRARHGDLGRLPSGGRGRDVDALQRRLIGRRAAGLEGDILCGGERQQREQGNSFHVHGGNGECRFPTAAPRSFARLQRLAMEELLAKFGGGEEASRKADQLWRMLDDLAARDPAAYRRFIETQRRAATEERPHFLPQPAFALRTATAAGDVLFINICSSDYIEKPMNAAGEAVGDDPAVSTAGLSIPLSVGHLRAAVAGRGVDKTDARVVDAVLNDWVTDRCARDAAFKMQVVELALQWVAQEHRLAKLRRDYKVLDEAYAGGTGLPGEPVPVPHYVESTLKGGDGEGGDREDAEPERIMTAEEVEAEASELRVASDGDAPASLSSALKGMDSPAALLAAARGGGSASGSEGTGSSGAAIREVGVSLEIGSSDAGGGGGGGGGPLIEELSATSAADGDGGKQPAYDMRKVEGGKRLRVDVHMPALSSMADVALDVSATALRLQAEPHYMLELALPATVLPDAVSAKWKKKKKTLVLKMGLK
eukprot:PLAT3287.25.p1 GENE.PLAT3287.25~~PLAT3287.25.p1  ORF type:complete len:890 (+),score=233.80 PLAT3287.25:149-2818(+)